MRSLAWGNGTHDWIGSGLGNNRYIESFLFGLKPTDALAILLAAGILIAVLVLACCDPVMRASRIDPLTALRHEPQCLRIAES